jgi:hypothetical protein
VWSPIPELAPVTIAIRVVPLELLDISSLRRLVLAADTPTGCNRQRT